MTKKDRLGKGLGALLGEYLGEGDGTPETRAVPVASVHPNPFQPRREFDEEQLAELASSIRDNGLLQPIVIRPAGNRAGSDRWELVAGERRWRAVTRLGWKQVPATVRSVDDRTLLVLALVENLQRSELGALEEAEGFHQLQSEFGLSQGEVASAVGRSRSAVANSLRLLQLPPSVRGLLEAGELTAGHARALLMVPEGRKMGELARQAVDEGWSVRQLEARARKLSGGGRGSSRRGGRGQKAASRDGVERALEQELERALGTQVTIRHTRGGSKGRIEVSYYDAADFERVFELLTGRPAVEVVS